MCYARTCDDESNITGLDCSVATTVEALNLALLTQMLRVTIHWLVVLFLMKRSLCQNTTNHKFS